MQVESDHNALPSGCVRCEYLESTGTQWIDTGVVLKSTYGIEVEIAPMELSDVTEHGVFGSSNGFSHNVLQIHRTQDNTRKGVILYMPNEIPVYAKTYNTTGIKQHWGININNEGKVYVDNILSGETKPTSVVSYAVALFGRNVNGYVSTSQLSKCRIYKFVIFESGKIIYSFIPILDQEGVPCMYDIVNKQFHYNKGTGQFLYKILEQ